MSGIWLWVCGQPGHRPREQRRGPDADQPQQRDPGEPRGRDLAVHCQHCHSRNAWTDLICVKI